MRTFRLSDREWDIVWAKLESLDIRDTATLFRVLASGLVEVRKVVKQTVLQPTNNNSGIAITQQDATTYDKDFDWGA